MIEAQDLSGGCLCGAVRYRVAGPLVDAGYCHCRTCQRSAGAPALAWGTWPALAFEWLAGRPASFRSSAAGRRQFCRECGTQLLFLSAAEPSLVDVNLVTLDNPDLIEPQYHIWTASRIGWFDTKDDLPRHADAGPDAPPV